MARVRRECNLPSDVEFTLHFQCKASACLDYVASKSHKTLAPASTASSSHGEGRQCCAHAAPQSRSFVGRKV